MRVAQFLFVAAASAFVARPPVVARLRGGAPVSWSAPTPGVAILVEVDVVEDRVAEFLEVADADAAGSRAEAGCLRFDVVQATPTKFFFYEVYTDADAVAVHKAQPYFQLWTDFKESGGCVSASTKGTFPAGGFT